MDASPRAVSPLRQRMIEDMRLHGYSAKTQTAYLGAVRSLAGHYHRTPEDITQDELRSYFLYHINIAGSFNLFAVEPPFWYPKIMNKLFLQQNAGSRKFTLGPATFQLGRTLFRSISGNLVDIAMPHLIDLCEKVGETVVLEVLSQNECVVTYMAQGKSSLSIGPRIGDRVPLHAAPGAKVMIAFQEPEVLERLLKGPLQRFTPKTITSQTFTTTLPLPAAPRGPCPRRSRPARRGLVRV